MGEKVVPKLYSFFAKEEEEDKNKQRQNVSL
jgi:hypothetical protein